MTPATSQPTRLERFALGAQGRIAVIALTATAIGAVAFMSSGKVLQAALFASSTTLLLLSLVLQGLILLHDRRKRLNLVTIQDFIENDSVPSLVTTAEGTLISLNVAAEKRFGHETENGAGVSSVLQRILANPGGATMRLKTKANREGAASEEFVTRDGSIRLSVHSGPLGQLVWRLEDVFTVETGTAGPTLPMILVGETDDVICMNDAARQLIGGRVETLDRLFRSNWTPGSFCNVATMQGTRRVFLSAVNTNNGRTALFLTPSDASETAEESWDIFKNLPVPLLKIRTDGHIEAFNIMAAKMIGPALDKDVHLSDLMEGLGRPISDWLKETVAGRAAQQTEFLRLKRMDKEVFVQVSLNRVTENGAPALIAVLNDATELKSLEAQFVQSQKMQAIGQLAGGVAHDFNNLLTAISGHCDLLLLRHDQGDPDFSDLVQINQNANRAAALVGQLLAFSRKQTLRPETLNMRDTLADLTHLLNRLVGEKVTLTLTHDPVLMPIRADKRQLEQVLMNLVVNARDAMPHGGEIRIDTQCTHLKEPLVRDRVNVPVGDYVTVRVSDEGVGIPSDKLQKVFEPFFTTKRTGEGTGLGLSTAYGIIKQTGGYIFVDSTVGAGTCFTLYFPVFEQDREAPQAQKKPISKGTNKRREGVILLVEDEAPVRAFASRALRLRGYTVLEADSAEAALKTLEDDDLSVDVFVTDVVMPGMDGPSWVRKALEDRPNVRVVFVSGYAEDSFGEAQTRIPNSVFLPKPFSLNDLTETVHQQLH